MVHRHIFSNLILYISRNSLILVNSEQIFCQNKNAVLIQRQNTNKNISSKLVKIAKNPNKTQSYT
jgi:hypothetical protein